MADPGLIAQTPDFDKLANDAQGNLFRRNRPDRDADGRVDSVEPVLRDALIPELLQSVNVFRLLPIMPMYRAPVRTACSRTIPSCWCPRVTITR